MGNGYLLGVEGLRLVDVYAVGCSRLSCMWIEVRNASSGQTELIAWYILLSPWTAG